MYLQTNSGPAGWPLRKIGKNVKVIRPEAFPVGEVYVYKVIRAGFFGKTQITAFFETFPNMYRKRTWKKFSQFLNYFHFCE